ncbi:hypothetical protein PPYR_00352 [Photinus pyralis]|uniref:ATPase AAA-type core domain-containing protein n=1 Tax=Photinus pyralis TaxID=7054 RepID=A0A5N4B1A8_PHOPY|nr:dynein regulatory complex protein 11-like [Photinus pyralis]KAB0803382.1 hypothetical protein PPYR_00352 [Photinus pyralis]
MSDEFYNTWWITTKKQLKDLRIRDAVLEKSCSSPITDRNIAKFFIGGLFTQYSLIVQNLCGCFDMLTTAQRRLTIGKLVDASVKRLNELKETLVQLDFSEYIYVDGNILECKLIPHDVEIMDPRLMCERSLHMEDLWTAIKNGETIYVPPAPPPDEVIDANTQTPDEDEEEEEGDHKKLKKKVVSEVKFRPPVIILTPEQIAEMERQRRVTEAAKLLQNHERARQGRIYYNDLDVQRKIRFQIAMRVYKEDAPIETRTDAAICIQRVWRGYIVRRDLGIVETRRRLLIGMTDPSWKPISEKILMEKNAESRRKIRYQRFREYVQASIDERARILRVIGPRLMEDITDEIRVWFHKWYDDCLNFDYYPTEDMGGSILIVRGETITTTEWLETRNRVVDLKAEKAKRDAAKKAEKERKKKEKERLKKEADAAKKREKRGEIEIRFPDFAAEEFKLGFKEEEELWDNREDSPKPYLDIIRDEGCYELQLEIRRQVDELMRIELELLNIALQKDGGKRQKRKKEKKRKKKVPKDPTGHRSIEDLFQELVDNGIIHTYPSAKLSDFLGDYSYGSWEARKAGFDPPQTLGDVRNAVMLNCILPMGVASMKKPKSVLIAGHCQSGKHLLANAIFNETQCVLFDLSSKVLVGKYREKKDITMLVHLINKLSRLLQPSIIFFDGAEKPFYKKIPPDEVAEDPKKLGGVLMKGIIKPITPNDKVLVLGITNQPFTAKPQLKKAYERIILIPRTDYGSLYLYWRQLLMAYHGVDRNMNLSELALVTRTYPLPAIKALIEKILNPIRIAQLQYKPLDAHEFVEVLLDEPPPIIDKLWTKYLKWFNSTPLAKRRAYLMRLQEASRQAAEKGAKKGK